MIVSKSINRFVGEFLFLLVGCSVLLMAAIFNGFPIVYPDTSTYIASGFKLEAPFDRPMTYGLFIRLFSLNGYSLWPVVIAQAILIYYLIRLHVACYLQKRSGWYSLWILFFLLATGLSWTVSQLMPDIFTAIGILSLFALIWIDHGRMRLILLYTIFFLSVAMHISHVMIFSLGILILIFTTWRSLAKKRRILFVCLILTVAAVAVMGSALGKSRHVFLMGAMVERGVVKPYLEEHCQDETFALCAYRDSLPEHAYDFVWNESSPVYKLGGWKACKPEFNRIIVGSITEPKFLLMQMSSSCMATLKQLQRFDLGDGNGRFNSNTELHQRIQEFIPRNQIDFATSKQQQVGFHLTFWNNLQWILILISLVVLMIIWVFRGGGLVRQHTLFIVLFIMINAMVAGAFANVIDRLGCKVMWMIPFALSIHIIRYTFQLKTRQIHPRG